MNILHGDSAAGSFKQAFKATQDELIVFNDVLSCGPLGEYVNIESWKSLREHFWNNIDYITAEERLSYSILERDFYARFKDFKSADEYKLWIGTGLSDQLLLAFLINLIDFHGLDFKKFLVYQFERISDKNFEVQGLGLLNPDQIRHHPSPYKLNEKQIKESKFAWEAVTERNPEKYLSYICTDNDCCMPLLKRAIAYLFYRYPKVSNGLSYWDETLLKYTEKHGPKTARIMGYTLTDFIEGLDLVGDFYLFGRLKNMGRPSLCKPLVKMNVLNLPMRKTETTILPDGLKALAGNINVIGENGIDDWVCGVHLDSLSDNVWVRNDDGLIFRRC
jgi:hypothetical protein